MTTLFRGVFFVLASLAVAVQTYAGDKGAAYSKNNAGIAPAAKLRVGRHAGYLRLVFETTESNVQKAYVGRSAGNSITVDFHSPVSFVIPQEGAPKTYVETGNDNNVRKKMYKIDKGLNIALDSASCIISLDSLVDINVSRLSLPSRLVIDAYISRGPSGSDTNTFVIDAGHGGYDSGVQFEKTAEKDLSLSVAKDIARALDARGMKVVLSRKGDQTIPLMDRARLVNSKSPTLLVSIHVSSRNEFVIYPSFKPVKPVDAAASNSEKSAGMSVSDFVAQEIAKNVRSSLKTAVRIEKKPLLLLSYVDAPAVLIELPSPEKFSYDKKSRERIIETILQAILHAVAGGSQA